MSQFLTDLDAYVQGNVAKLVQVATVHGNLIIVNDKDAGEKILSNLDKDDQQLSWRDKELQDKIKQITDETEKIDLTIKSRRFGQCIKLKAAWDMKVWAFCHYVVKILALPRGKNIPELGISFSFSYKLCRINQLDEEVSLLEEHISLREAGIIDGDELQLQVDLLLEDPEVDKLEGQLMMINMGHYFISPYETIQRIKGEIQSIRKRLYDEYAEDILKEPWFDYLNAQV